MAETISYKSDFIGLGKELYLSYQMADFTKLTEIVILLMIVLILSDMLLSLFKKKLEINIS